MNAHSRHSRAGGKPAHTRRLGFTLIELLVVMAIIAILIALLLPAIQAAREAARRTQCTNALKQLALGVLNYESALKSFPIGGRFPAGQNGQDSDQFQDNWVIAILPYIEFQSLYDNINHDLFISDPANLTARSTKIPVMICPSDLTGHKTMFSMDGGSWARGNYAANGGMGYYFETNGPSSASWINSNKRGVMAWNSTNTLTEIADGTSSTVMLYEIRTGLTDLDRRGSWAMGTAGASIVCAHGVGDDVGPNTCNDNSDDIENANLVPLGLLRLECMGNWPSLASWQATARSRHSGGIQAAMCDGSVHFFSNYIEAGAGKAWNLLSTSQDNQPLDAAKVGF